jgi:hypothetical protein
MHFEEEWKSNKLMGHEKIKIKNHPSRVPRPENVKKASHTSISNNCLSFVNSNL